MRSVTVIILLAFIVQASTIELAGIAGGEKDSMNIFVDKLTDLFLDKLFDQVVKERLLDKADLHNTTLLKAGQHSISLLPSLLSPAPFLIRRQLRTVLNSRAHRLWEQGSGATEGKTESVAARAEAATAAASRDRLGKVFLVGAGPGPVELLTLKAARLLKVADVVIHDDLLSNDMLEIANPQAELVYVGKRGGQKSISQDEINRLLILHCKQGKQVIRLKGGCCAVFSRVHSEIDSLLEASCEIEVVPGISSSLAGPLKAGLALTDRLLSRHFAVTSAHNPSSLDWSVFKGIDTLVILMAGRKLGEVMQKLQSEALLPPSTPVVIIKSAFLADEIVWTGSIENIEQMTAAHDLSPCIIVVGDVVSSRLGEC